MNRNKETRTEILRYLKQHVSFNESEESERLEQLIDDDSIIEITINNQLVGVFQINRWKSYTNQQHAEIVLACDQHDETLALAKSMLSEIITTLHKEGVSMIKSCVNDDYERIAQLFHHYNFNEWYGFVFMRHDQSLQPISNLKKRTIEADDFDTYYEEMGKCFVPMRKAMDIKPYNVLDALFSTQESKDKEAKQWIENKDKTWMYFNQENQWVGSGLIVGTDFDDIFVLGEMQNKGYGKQIVLDLLSEARNLGFNPFIGYVKWNKKAGQLYESCGFVKTMSCTYSRLYVE